MATATRDKVKPHRYRPSQDLRFTQGPIKPDWQGRTVVLIAGGPSLTKGQVTSVKHAYYHGEIQAIGVNDAYRLAPWVDGLYAADPPWWELHIKAVRETYIPNLYCQDEHTSRRWGLRWTPGPKRGGHLEYTGLSFDPNRIHYGSHSGFQALNIAVLMGAKKIILLGYDMKPGAGGKMHWFGEHPETSGLCTERDFGPWVEFYDQAAGQLADRGIQVLNCSPDSAINCFPKTTITAALWP